MERSSTELIKEKLPVEEVIGQYVKLSRAGKDYKGLCPFHGEKSPSFFVSPDKNVWHCFGCGKGGDLFTFVEEIEGLEFRDALELLADKAGIELKHESGEDRSKRQLLLEILEEATLWYEENLEQEQEESRVWGYLKERGVSRELATEFRLGVAPDDWMQLVEYLTKKKYKPEDIEQAGLATMRQNSEGAERSYLDRFRGRIMFPIQNVQGTTTGFSGRILPWVAEKEEQRGRTSGKYINTPSTPVYDKSRAIYGLYQAKSAIRKGEVVVLVEGQLDVLLSHKIGFRQAVAASGTAFTKEHARIVNRYADKIIMLFDMDDAGENAARRAFGVAAAAGMDVKVGALPAGTDPADVAHSDPDIYEDVLSNALDAVSFFIERSVSRNDVTSARGKRAVMNEIVPLLATIEGAVEKSHWASELGHALQTSEKVVLQEINATEASNQEPAGASVESSPLEKQSRRVLLEEHLCGLVLQFSSLGNQLDLVALEIFTSGSVRGIMEAVVRDRPSTLSDLHGGLTREQATTAARLAFQVEKRIPDSDAAEKEFLFLYGDLQRAHLRDMLQSIGVAMRSAESSGDAERLAELQSEFTEISQQLNELG